MIVCKSKHKRLHPAFAMWLALKKKNVSRSRPFFNSLPCNACSRLQQNGFRNADGTSRSRLWLEGPLRKRSGAADSPGSYLTVHMVHVSGAGCLIVGYVMGELCGGSQAGYVVGNGRLHYIYVSCRCLCPSIGGRRRCLSAVLGVCSPHPWTCFLVFHSGHLH